MNTTLRKQILREFPELAAGYHLPIMAEVTAINDAPIRGGINDNYRPRLAVDVVLLSQDYSHTDIILSAVPVAIQGGGNERGFFALPPAGTIVELAWLNGLPERPFVRSILGDRQALPWLDADSMSWQQSEAVKQHVDSAGNWERKTSGLVTDEAHEIRHLAATLHQQIGQETKRIIEHSLEDIDGKKVIEAGAIHQLSASVLNLLALGSINQVAADHLTRTAGANIVEKANGSHSLETGKGSNQTFGGDLIQTSSGNAVLIGKKVHVGSESTNVLALIVDLMGEMVTALNAVATLTVVSAAPGSPTSVPVNAASFTNVSAKIKALKSKLSAITK